MEPFLVNCSWLWPSQSMMTISLLPDCAGNKGDVRGETALLAGHDQHDLVGKGMGKIAQILGLAQIALGGHHLPLSTSNRRNSTVRSSPLMLYSLRDQQLKTGARPGNIIGPGQGSSRVDRHSCSRGFRCHDAGHVHVKSDHVGHLLGSTAVGAGIKAARDFQRPA